MEPRRAGARGALIPMLALGVVVVVPGLVTLSAVAADTFAFDFLAYHQAAQRVLQGGRLYDPSIQVTGGFGLFYYPPPFVLLMLPFGLLAPGTATWLWLGMSAVVLVAAVGILPVTPAVRWATLLLAGLSWPVAYALKLGQVGPLLLFLFALAWRMLDRTLFLGSAGALGAIVKIQPGIVLAWAMLTRRWGAVALGFLVLIAAAVAATAVAGGPSIWFDYVALLRNVSDPITTPHNFTPGSVAHQMGVPIGLASGIQIGSSVLAAVLVAFAAMRLRADVSLLIAIVASQLLSPILWDHYGLFLLLPVAWLLERRRRWAVAIPLSTSVLLLPFALPAIVVPIGFWVTLLALLSIGWRERASDLRAEQVSTSRGTFSVPAITVEREDAGATSGSQVEQAGQVRHTHERF